MTVKLPLATRLRVSILRGHSIGRDVQGKIRLHKDRLDRETRFGIAGIFRNELEFVMTEFRGSFRLGAADNSFLQLVGVAENFICVESRTEGQDLKKELEKTAIVVRNVLQIISDVSGINKEEKQALVIAAILNNVGWASIKIRTESFRADINRRIAMEEGGRFARFALEKLPSSFWSVQEEIKDAIIDNVVRLISHYDDPSLTPPQNYNADNQSGFLSLILREADRLYMLSHKGIEADVKREKDGITDYVVMLMHNASRIRQERERLTHDVRGKLFITGAALNLFNEELRLTDEMLGGNERISALKIKVFESPLHRFK